MSFDPAAYWVERHSRFATSERAIENLRKDEQHAIAASIRYQQLFGDLLALPAMVAWRDLAPRTALDLGAGIGRLSQPLREAGYNYLGVEVSPIAVTRARKSYPGVEMQIADLRKFKSYRQFDLIVCSYVLVHVVDDVDWHRVLDNVAAMLGPDGRFILIDELDEPTHRPAEHVMVRHRSDYNAALQAVGLRFNELTAEFQKLYRHYHLVDRT
jgi:SAM-dependent methyltransferase